MGHYRGANTVGNLKKRAVPVVIFALVAQVLFTGTVAPVADATTVPSSDPSGVVSDDFNACSVDPGVWSLVDPLGGGSAQVVGGGTGDAQLELTVPGGTAHDAWTAGNGSVRLMQAMNDADFEVETKIDSVLTASIQIQGLLVEESVGHFLRFDTYKSGGSVRIFGAVIKNGSPAIKVNKSIPASTPTYLRIERVGDAWTLSYSFDAAAWTTAATFTHSMTTTRVGLMAGNAGGSTPAHTAVFDYLFNTASPVVNEDQGAVPADLTLDVTVVGGGTVQATPSASTYSCGEAVTLEAIPDPGYVFDAWTGDLSGTDNPFNIVMTSNVAGTATFLADVAGPVISNVVVTPGQTTATITWDTDEPATTRVDFGETTTYDNAYEDLTLTTSHSASLTGLTADTLYHFQLTSTDSGGLPTTTPDDTFTTEATNVAPVISNVVVTPGQTTATITWDTDEPATTRVDFGETTTYDNAYEDLTLTTSHSASLTGLTADTLYHFQLTSTDSGGLPTTTPDDTFTTEATNVAPVISNVVVTPGQTTATITWDTDEPATTRVDFGETTTYDNAYEDLTLTTSHSASLTGLTADTLYHFQLTSTDSGGLPTTTPDDTFTTQPSSGDPSGVVSDDFNACSVDPSVWSLVDPLGGGSAQVVGGGTGDAQLELTVPGGTAHDAWTAGNGSVRLMQAMNDADFEVETKIDSVLTASIQIQGLLVEESVGHFLRFDTYKSGGSVRIFGAVIKNGSPAIKVNKSIPASTPTYLRIERVGDAWTLSYSFDAAAWTTAATFTHSMTTTRVGLMAGNAGGSTPAHTAVFDYLFNTASPVVNEDQGAVPADLTLDVTVVGGGTVQATPSASTYSCGEAVTLEAIPDPGYVFDAWTGDLSGTDNPFNIVMTSNVAGTATFLADVAGPVISNVVVTPGQTTATITWDTDEPATTRVDFGETTTYDNAYEDLTLTTSHSASLTGLTADTLYHFQLTSTDSGGLPTTTPDDTFTTEATNVAPVISNVVVTPGQTTATITWDTDEPATTRVDFGETTTYDNAYEDLTLTTSHSASLTGLTADTLYHFQLTSTDSGGLPTTTPDDTFTTEATNVAPVISNVVVTPGQTTATITWDTDEPATTRVDFGETTTYDNAYEDLTLTTSHSASLTGLTADTLYHFQLTSTDSGGLPTTTPDDTFTTQPSSGDPSGVVSDDFNACSVDPGVWSLVDPLGGGSAQVVGGGTGDAQLELTVPGGTAHDAWTAGNGSVRLMQAMNDADFEVETKIDSVLTASIQIQGLLVEESVGHFLRFDTYKSGGSVRIFGAVIKNGSPAIKVNKSIPASTPTYLRIERVGDAWTLSYSFDAAAWTTAATFTHSMTTTRVGLMAGNAGGSTPAHTAVFDYLFNTASPVVNEDQGAVPADLTLDVTVVGGGTVQATPSASTYSCGEAVTLEAIPDPGYVFDAWTGDLSGTDNPFNIVMTSNVAGTATFLADVAGPVISNVVVTPGQTTATITWDTDEPATTRVDFGETTTYDNAYEDLTLTTSHSASLTGLTADTLYHFQLTSTDSGGLPTTTPDDTFTTQPSSGDPGPTFTIWFGPTQTVGLNGVPNPDANLMGNVDDPDGVSELYYSLNGGAEVQLSIGPNSNRLAAVGDFNADIAVNDLVVGSNTVNLRAVDGLGNESTEAVTINHAPGNVPSMNYTFDWSSATEISDIAQVVDGHWALQGNSLTVVERGYDRFVGLGDLTWDDYELVVPITVHEIRNPTSPGPGVGVAVRWGGHGENFPGEQPAADWTDSIGGLAMWRVMSGGDEIIMMWDSNGSIVEQRPRAFELDVEHLFKMRAETLADGSHQYSFKMWDASLSEPAGWDIVNNEPNGQQTSGSVLLVAHHSIATFGDVVVTEVTTNPNNQAPLADDDSYTIDEDMLLSRDTVTGVLANDSDPDGDPLQALVLTDVTSGQLSLATDGSFTYQPDPNFNGIDSFTYRVSDGSAFSNVATVTLTVQAIPDPPIANNDSYSTTPNVQLSVNATSGVLANDSDPDGESLQAAVVTDVADGTLSLLADGSFDYQPDPGFEGTDSFTYEASDGNLTSPPATVNITVSAFNAPPEFATGAVDFAKITVDTTMDETHAVAAADFDGDSDIDLVATDYIDGAVEWFRNDGGTYTRVMLDPALAGAYPIHAADVDGDGDVDVLAAGYTADTVAWYENDGAGNFARHDIVGNHDGPHSVVTTDIDEDGDIDVLTTNQDSDTVLWFENDGNENFTEHMIDAFAEEAKRAEPADVDGDGDIDVVVGSHQDDIVAWHENDGNEVFTEHLIDGNADGVYFVSPGDLDGDGDMDVLAALKFADMVVWYENDGSGDFTKHILGTDKREARTVIAADFDGDGDLDAASASLRNDRIHWYENDGSGGFTERLVDPAANGAYGLAAADVDLDGDLDLVAALKDSNAVVVYEQIAEHTVAVASGSTLVIDNSLLLTVDADNGPEELTYRLVNLPNRGEVRLNGVVLDAGGTFTQADVNAGDVVYVHDGSRFGSDPFSFTVDDAIAPALGGSLEFTVT